MEIERLAEFHLRQLIQLYAHLASKMRFSDRGTRQRPLGEFTRPHCSRRNTALVPAPNKWGFNILKYNCWVLLAAVGIASLARADIVLFDFDNAPLHSPLPLDLSAGGITAHFSATGQGYSIQQANALGFTPTGFAGYCIYPSSVFAADLVVGFSQPVTSFSILYAPEEYDTDSSARMRVTTYMNNTFAGTNTTTANPPGTWPSATLSISSLLGFNNLVVHYDAPPPTGGDWGPIFMADNMQVTFTPVPEPSSLALLILGLGSLVGFRRKRSQPSQ